MTTLIEDNALSNELHELYQVSKQWLSELTFLENELGFLRKRITTDTNLTDHHADLEKIANIEKTHGDLKTHIMHYLHRLEPLIANARQPFDLNLIENYILIKAELDRFSIEIQSVKYEALKPHQK